LLCIAFAALAAAQDTGTLVSRRSSRDFPLSANPNARHWRQARSVATSSERWGKEVPNARTEIRSRWTEANLYFLFVSQFETLHRMPGTVPGKETWGLWDYDVAEVFIGHDLERIHLYKEFEVSPWEEWVDLEVDRNRTGKEVDWLWNSGFRFRTRIDARRKVWYCEMQIPWSSIDPRTPKPGNQLRLNLYRIEGEGKDRKYIAWRAVNSPSYHTPEAFGRLILE
jgi:hypothetical protein